MRTITKTETIVRDVNIATTKDLLQFLVSHDKLEWFIWALQNCRQIPAISEIMGFGETYMRDRFQHSEYPIQDFLRTIRTMYRTSKCNDVTNAHLGEVWWNNIFRYTCRWNDDFDVDCIKDTLMVHWDRWLTENDIEDFEID